MKPCNGHSVYIMSHLILFRGDDRCIEHAVSFTAITLALRPITWPSCVVSSPRIALSCPRLVSPLRRGLFAAGDTGAAEGDGRKAPPSQPTLAIVGQGRGGTAWSAHCNCGGHECVFVLQCISRDLWLVEYLNCECFKTSLMVSRFRGLAEYRRRLLSFYCHAP